MLGRIAPRSVAVGVAMLFAMVAAAAGPEESTDSVAAPPRRSQQEVMAAQGFVRYRGAWRTVQEIELIERAERANVARKEWVVRLERLRQQCDQPAQSGRAAEEIRGISDPFAVPAVSAALVGERAFAVRGLYVEALGRIGSGEAVAALVSTAIDHPDRETRIAAVDRLAALGRHRAVPGLVAALGSPDNARVNGAAEALGRLGDASAVAPLIEALETTHVAVVGDGGPEGSTTATFTPAGGGLSMGGGRRRASVPVKNERVLESLVTLTGANFGWDAAAWRAWLANRQSPPDFDPRRG
ncbi:MAG: HEAT repeat domain-containing protein [Planctomycetia bacterium]|nr:HEAT repeat domain-containing protein [Planctomycetia bacterium]